MATLAQGSLYWGRGLRIATTNVRAGLAMTHRTAVTQWPGWADRGVRPYGSATRGAMGGRPQGSPLRKRCKGGEGRAESPSHGFAVPAPFRQGGRGREMRIATGAERPRNDRSRKNLRVIPRPVRRLVVGSEPSAASGRGSEVSEWLRSKFPASAVRQRRNFRHRNRVIRNIPAQRSRRTDCHSQCAHWLRNDIFLQGVRCKSGRSDRGVRPYGSVTRGAMGGRPQGSPLRSAAMNVWAGYRPLRKFFDREGMVCFGFWWRRMTRAPGC